MQLETIIIVLNTALLETNNLYMYSFYLMPNLFIWEWLNVNSTSLSEACLLYRRQLWLARPNQAQLLEQDKKIMNCDRFNC